MTPPATTAPLTSQPRAVGEVPGQSGGPLAAVRRLRADPLTRLTQLRDEHGPIVRLSTWPVSAFLVSDPAVAADALVSGHRAYAKGAVVRGAGSRTNVTQPLTYLLGDGLLTSAGDVHRRQRRLIQPLFHKHRIAEYGEQFVCVTDDTAATWRDGQRLDLHAEMTEMTLGIVARTLFDVPLDDEVVTVVRDAVARNLPAARRAALPGFTRVEQLPVGGPARRRDSREALDRAVYEMIADRRATGATGSDLLSLLLDTQDADTGERMSDSQIRDEAMTLLLAGHETTANALAWTFHLLGEHRDVAARLHAEVDAVLGGRPPTFEDLPRLAYTNAVFSESMRLFPPVWAMGRHLVEDREVAGYLLPAGSTLVFSQWVIHRDERWWPDPTRFDPTRWLDADESGGTGQESTAGGPHAPGRPRFAYFPFGGGPRQCIGNSFAVAEGVLALATIARRWSFTAATGDPVVPEPLVTLRPKGGLPMIAHLRH
ncbi:cytochrome P450 [Frankia sp. AgB1.9]|uniref:cytochrome P450 n=1 Tax=unclassified Frankia TaxID=2632575 RepID=UPI001933DFE2|nr:MULTISPECIES: cytochrome P450 [unclassified Frankia]MBL7548480.1 cytochrome P450 [Frankia sp. AgB1.9]MBL7623077.1 cytochrome P450 [Frankia sp. AgB1.8]